MCSQLKKPNSDFLTQCKQHQILCTNVHSFTNNAVIISQNVCFVADKNKETENASY